MQKFSSKKDWWIVAFVICMSGLLIQLLLVMSAKGTWLDYPLHTTVYVLTIIVLWWPLWSTRYRVEADFVIIQSMWMKWRIPLSSIQKIEPSDFSSLAPALSLKRLRIEYEQAGTLHSILISPKDQQAFLRAIEK